MNSRKPKQNLEQDKPAFDELQLQLVVAVPDQSAARKARPQVPAYTVRLPAIKGRTIH